MERQQRDAHWFVRGLREYKDLLTRQQVKSIRGMALSGNMEQAEKSLNTALRKYKGLQ